MPALRKAISSVPSETFAYPTGMVWCPMKMSGMAIMRCARLQKDLGCGTRLALQTLRATNPERVVLFGLGSDVQTSAQSGRPKSRFERSYWQSLH